MTARFTVHASHPNYGAVLDRVGIGEKDFAQAPAIDLPG